MNRRFPWVALVLLALSVYGFWVLPQQMGNPPIRVTFTD